MLMIIIAEKINGSIPSMAKAIAERNEEYIKDVAKKQADSGASYIDVCASVEIGEVETLQWLIGLVQEVTDLPIAVDSPDVNVVIEGMKVCNKPGLFNSVSGEGNKIDIAFPVIAGTDWNVMALLCDDTGISKTAADRIRVMDNIMARVDEFKIPHDQVHIDPLVEMLCTSEDGISMFLEVVNYIKTNYPKVHISGAISNISFNLPYRKILNIAFAVMAIAAGMDSSVMDPLSRDLRGAIYAAEALTGEDFMCMEYIGAFRESIFGPAPKD